MASKTSGSASGLARLVSRRNSVLFLLVLAAAALILVNQTWLTVRFAAQASAVPVLAASGVTLHSGLLAFAMAIAAAAVALTIARAAGRVVLGILLAGLGGGLAFLAGSVAADPLHFLRGQIAEKTGLSGGAQQAAIAGADTASWHVLVQIIAALVVATGVLVAIVGMSWQNGASRYDRQSANISKVDKYKSSAASQARHDSQISGLVDNNLKKPEESQQTSRAKGSAADFGQRRISDWELLSAGEDPSADSETK
ncbi:MAG: Trp biosynthesis-associated membrane protein [Microbacteriaceae bacterium]|nr:Trp biosynthesis-associated membrane protein [Microbacteriaceae bacterium]